MEDVQWDSLVESLQTGSCVLVLGPDIPAVSLAVDATSLNNKTSVRGAFCDYLITLLEKEDVKIHERVLFALAQQYEESRAPVNLKNIAAKFFRTAPYGPGPIHLELSRCPFSLIL